MNDSCWRLDSAQAVLRFPTPAAADPQLASALPRLWSYSTSQPGRGLVVPPELSDGLAGAHLLGVALAGCVDAQTPLNQLTLSGAEPEEGYVRGTDLVMRYLPPAKLPLRTRLYYRALPQRAVDRVLWAMELIVAVDTGLLDSDPTSAVVTTLPAATAGTENWSASCAAGRIVVPLAEGLTYAQMAHPDGDSVTAVETPADGGVRIVHRLFAGRLEKGVVLTQRVLAVVIAGPDAVSQAAAEHQWFAASPPPLTT